MESYETDSVLSLYETGSEVHFYDSEELSETSKEKVAADLEIFETTSTDVNLKSDKIEIESKEAKMESNQNQIDSNCDDINSSKDFNKIETDSREAINDFSENKIESKSELNLVSNETIDDIISRNRAILDTSTNSDEIPNDVKDLSFKLKRLHDFVDNVRSSESKTVMTSQHKVVMTRNFIQPFRARNFLKRVKTQRVSLERVTPLLQGRAMYGIIRVSKTNHVFDDVYIKLSTNGWRSFEEVEAIFERDISLYYQHFYFVLHAPNDITNNDVIEMIACARDVDGREFRDDNQRLKYRLNCYVISDDVSKLVDDVRV